VLSSTPLANPAEVGAKPLPPLTPALTRKSWLRSSGRQATAPPAEAAAKPASAAPAKPPAEPAAPAKPDQPPKPPGS
jgi:hypothetical protein